MRRWRTRIPLRMRWMWMMAHDLAHDLAHDFAPSHCPPLHFLALVGGCFPFFRFYDAQTHTNPYTLSNKALVTLEL